MAAKDPEEMRQWLTEIHRCIRPAVSSWVVSENKRASAAAAVSLRQPLTVELPPPQPTSSSAAGSASPGTAAVPAVTNGVSSNDSLDVRDTATPGTGPVSRSTPEDGAANLYTELCDYPWFHGCLSRTDASQLVMQSTLVAASESRYKQHNIIFDCYLFLNPFSGPTARSLRQFREPFSCVKANPGEGSSCSRSRAATRPST